MKKNKGMHIPQFKRIRNFRDLGGYITDDEKQIIKGRLFRSGNLANLRGRDKKLFRDLQIDTIIDFRSETELKNEPDRIPSDMKINYLSFPLLEVDNNTFSMEFRKRILENNFDDFNPDGIMEDIYRKFPVEFTEEYGAFLQAVIDANGKPVLFHCTAGKDRTGFAAAILLRLLGVDMNTVISDYLLSKKYGGFSRRLLLLIWIKSGKKAVDFVRSLSIVNEKWLMASFEVIDEKWGSFENFIQNGLNFSEDKIHYLKTILLK